MAYFLSTLAGSIVPMCVTALVTMAIVPPDMQYFEYIDFKTLCCLFATLLVVCALKNHGIEPKRLQFVCAKNKAPYLVLIEGVKGGKSGVNILENLIN